ncbi:MAG TPA: PEP-CTERM sorting domain-containing protein [Verrucomicrobiae bacterium]|nr:PEP-CTERM sorting domain-containing protein [Verrucomicrobiae bacterium]
MKKIILSTLAATVMVVAANAQNTISWQYANGGIIPSNGSSYAGVALAPFWNNSQEAGVANLLASDGSSSGVSLGITDQYGAWGIGNVISPDTDGYYNKAILDGYANTATSDALSLGGISFSQYDVIVYLSSDTDGRTGTISDGTTTFSFTTMAVAAVDRYNDSNAILTQTTDTGSGNPQADYAIFSNLTGSSQTFTMTINGGGIAGMQIVGVPEPGTLALAGLSGFGLLIWRRRIVKL